MIDKVRRIRAWLYERGVAATAPAVRFFGYVSQARFRPQSTATQAGLAEMVRHFAPWWRSFSEPAGVSEISRPWLTYPAIDFIVSEIKPDWRVFEFGAGGSTVFFARNCLDVRSVEHDGEWADRLGEAVAVFGLKNCSIRYIVPEPLSADHSDEFRSGVERFKDLSFEQYVRAIECCEDQSLDVVLVDGRARIACVKVAISKLRAGGLLILDDSDRDRYQDALGTIPETWRRLDFPGPYAKTTPFGRTSIWVVPKSSLSPARSPDGRRSTTLVNYAV